MQGKILKQLRMDNDLSVKELSEKLNTSASNIRMMELDQRKGSIEVITAISKLFNVSIDYLEGLTEYKNKSEIVNDIVDRISMLTRNEYDIELNDKIVNIITDYIEKKH